MGRSDSLSRLVDVCRLPFPGPTNPAHPPEPVSPGPGLDAADEICSWEKAWIDLGGEG
jgi:hypothetical protein